MAKQPLDDYRRMRDFGATPEPDPARPGTRSGPPVFVIHRHAARNLHWDLRLEMEGVLRSWAVPRGFSYDSSEKRLAVRTEDHPLEYEHFDGIIPAGQYGAGSMTIWDRGTYQLVSVDDTRTPEQAVERGELKVILHGRRLRGEWHVVKTSGGPKHWLLFKSKDLYAGPAGDSVLGVDLTPARELDAGRELAIEEVLHAQGPVEPFSDADWLFEAELDGRRALARKRAHGTSFATRDGELVLPQIAAEMDHALTGLRAEDALLDGVLVVSDEHERPSRAALDAALESGQLDRVVFYAFDLLTWNGLDLRALGTLERKQALRAILPRNPERVLFADHVAGEGQSLAAVASAGGLPALIAKRAQAPYALPSSGAACWLRIPLAPGQPRGSLSEALAAAPNAQRPSRVRFTNLDKQLWPADASSTWIDGRPVTKGELISFYEDAAGFLLPHLRDRPVHMNRFPDGITGKSFYQREAKQHTPAWIRSVPIASDSKSKQVPHIVCDDRDTLLWMANAASIDLHPWLSRVSTLDSPDWTVLDLDPKQAPFAHVVRIARAAGKLLTGIGLRPLLKTSGASGLHIFVPLLEGYSYEQSRMFCEAVARALCRELKDIATVERAIAARDGKVYLDFGQNRRSQTIVPPYCVRPVPGASVSTPLSWDELDGSLTPRQFTFDAVRERLERHGDLFRAALTDRQDLLPAIEGLADVMNEGQGPSP